MALPAVTTQRIEAVLKDEELEYGIDDDNEVEQKYISMFSDDTKARQEFVELYKQKGSA